MLLVAVGVASLAAGALITAAGLAIGVASLWAARSLRGCLAARRILLPHRAELLALSGAGLWALAIAAGPSRTVVVDLLMVGALVSSLWVACALRRPRPVRGQRFEVVRDRVRAIVSVHGEDSLSPYVLRPDKEFKIAGDGLVAFTVIADTVVISGDPVGPPEAAVEALAGLARRAHRAGLRMVAFGASDEYRDSFAALGMHAICAGEEAVVDPAAFSLEGRAVRKLRQSARRPARLGWELSLREGRDIDLSLEAEIATVEARWRAAQPRILGFAMSMGAFEAPIGPDDLFALARSPEGELRGVMRLLAHRGKLSLDVMRRVGETPNGMNEALICEVLERARETGVTEVSLNYAGLGHLLRPGGEGRLLRAALGRPPLAWLRRRFQLDHLVAFNQKFSPIWRPRYLMVDSRVRLPLALWRVLQAEGHLRRPPTWTEMTTVG